VAKRYCLSFPGSPTTTSLVRVSEDFREAHNKEDILDSWNLLGTSISGGRRGPCRRCSSCSSSSPLIFSKKNPSPLCWQAYELSSLRIQPNVRDVYRIDRVSYPLPRRSRKRNLTLKRPQTRPVRFRAIGQNRAPRNARIPFKLDTLLVIMVFTFEGFYCTKEVGVAW